MSIKFLFAWYDAWLGLFLDRTKHRLYVFPVPMLGCYIQFPIGAAWLPWKLKWGLWQNIRDLDGSLKLTRVKLTPATPWGQLYVHIFHKTEANMPLHDHAYDYWTLPFTDYVERVKVATGTALQFVPAWRITHRPAEHAHVVIGPCERGRGFPFCTLFWQGPQRRKWGLFTPHGWTYWKDYYALHQT